MAKNFISLAHVFGLLLIVSFIGVAPAMAGQNGFGDVMAATSYFPTRNMDAFGTDDSDALIASAAPDSVNPVTAATMNAIVPAAGDATVHTELYGPFQPGKEPAAH